MLLLADEGRKVHVHFPEAEVTQVVPDHLDTHEYAACYETFASAEARRLARKLQVEGSCDTT